MKLILENFRKFISEAKKMVCPPATQDLELNTKNRDELSDKEFDLVYEKKLLLSQWAEKFGASWEIRDITELGESYIKIR